MRKKGLPFGRLACRPIACSMAVSIAMLFTTAAQAAPPQYTVNVINTAGESSAAGINNHGQVAGNLASGSAFFYTPDVGVTDIGALGGGTATARAINDHGQVVGNSRYFVPGFGFRDNAFVYTPGGAMTGILPNLPGYDLSEANDINNDGLVTVFNYHDSIFPRSGGVGYIYNAASGVLTNLNIAMELDPDLVFPGPINELGIPAGSAGGAGRAAILAPHVNPLTGEVSSYQDLGTLGGIPAFANDINDNGLAVGSSQTTAGLAAAAVFYGGGLVVNIGGASGSLQSWAASINNADQIVGNSQSAVNTNIFHGFVRVDGVNYDLNDVIDPGLGISGIRLETLLGRADAINEWGQIAAYGFVAGVGTRALILSPVDPVASGVNLTVPGTAFRTTKFVDGMNFDTFTSTTNPLPDSLHTTVELLDGTAGANRDVVVGFDATGSFGGLASDVVTVSGTATDVFVLQINYDEALALSIFGGEANAYLSWRDPIDNIWKNAVLGNTGGTPASVIGPYDSLLHFQLGNYGVDTLNNTVWAVLNHNSDFAVIGVPEPSTLALTCSASLLMGIFWRRCRPRLRCERSLKPSTPFLGEEK